MSTEPEYNENEITLEATAEGAYHGAVTVVTRMWDRRMLRYFNRLAPGAEGVIQSDVGRIFDRDMEEFHSHNCEEECTKGDPAEVNPEVCNYTNLWLFEGEETNALIHFALRGLVDAALEDPDSLQKLVITLA